MARRHAGDEKQKWSDWLNGQLDATGMTSTDLRRASGDRLEISTISNWKIGRAAISAEFAVIVAHAFGVPASEALLAASFPEMAAIALRAEQRPFAPEQPAEPPPPPIEQVPEYQALPDDVKPKVAEYYKALLARAAERAEADALDFGQQLADRRRTA